MTQTVPTEAVSSQTASSYPSFRKITLWLWWLTKSSDIGVTPLRTPSIQTSASVGVDPSAMVRVLELKSVAQPASASAAAANVRCLICFLVGSVGDDGVGFQDVVRRWAASMLIPPKTIWNRRGPRDPARLVENQEAGPVPRRTDLVHDLLPFDGLGDRR